MFTGHYAPALLLRRAFPTAPLWALCVAVQAVDIGFSSLALLGVESARITQAAPRLVVTEGVWTHSLVMTGVWATLAAGLTWGAGCRRLALPIGLAVASHWFGDLLVHTPDLPLTFDPATAVGFSLWLHRPVAWALEVGLLLFGWALLRPTLAVSARRALDRLVGGLVTLQTLSDFVVPLPPDLVSLGMSTLVFYALVPAAAARVDRVGRLGGVSQPAG